MSHTGLKDEAGVILYLSTSPMKIPAQHIVFNQHKKSRTVTQHAPEAASHEHIQVLLL